MRESDQPTNTKYVKENKDNLDKKLKFQDLLKKRKLFRTNMEQITYENNSLNCLVFTLTLKQFKGLFSVHINSKTI